MDHGIVVHGGAWSIPDEHVEDHLDGVIKACKKGSMMLREGKPAIDVVEKVVEILENDPTYDAGKGSHLNDHFEVEMDAIIATPPFEIGSVAGIKNVKNPVNVARLIRDKTDHILLVGEGATSFAKDQGIELIDTEELLVGRELETFKRIKGKPDFRTKDPFRKQSFGTVGAVCKDKFGNFAIAVSTGGTAHKLAGRVGDTPLWGAGGYVDSWGGAAATGYGEDLIRILATNRTVTYMKEHSANKAALKTIDDLDKIVNGLGGIISINNDGIGLAFNTPRMAFSYQIDDEPIIAGINPEDVPHGLL